mmetsp:Transcript_102746/g.204032  ORF Transcript_102746/g.204032 Transcript_102746/m.204032 type:complete len:257 (-) Transcript_102746:122-892(-)
MTPPPSRLQPCSARQQPRLVSEQRPSGQGVVRRSTLPVSMPHSLSCAAIGRGCSTSARALLPPAGLGVFLEKMLPLKAHIDGHDPADPLDQVVYLALAQVGRQGPCNLSVRRLSSGRYVIDGRPVVIRFGINPVTYERSRPLAREEFGDFKLHEVDLHDYLYQAANVAAFLNGRAPGAPGVARVPKHLRVSFAETGAAGSSATLADVRRGLLEDGTQRTSSMRLACEQAQLRAQAAEMLERHGPIWQQIGQVAQAW